MTTPNTASPSTPAEQAPIDIENRSVIAALETEIESLKAQLDTAQRIARIDAALIKAGAKNPACVRALLDMEQLKVDINGKIAGLDDAIATIRQEEPYLFHENNPDGLFGFRPAESFRQGEADPFVRGFLGL